jgi:hypothetical protein
MIMLMIIRLRIKRKHVSKISKNRGNYDDNYTAQYKRIVSTYDIGNKNRNQKMRVKPRTGKVQTCDRYKAETYKSRPEQV